MYYYIYRNSDSELISDSSALIPPKDGYTVLSFNERQSGKWNSETLSFEAQSVSKKYSKHDFYKKVTHGLYYKAHAASKNNIPIESFLRYLEGMETVNLEDGELLEGVALLVSELVWTQTEANEVLA